MTIDPEHAAMRGRQAASELRETEAAFEAVRSGLIEAWASSTLGDSEFREKAFLSVQILDAVKAALITTATGAAMAENDQLIANILAGRDPA